MRDPRHKQEIPSGSRLAIACRQVFRRMQVEALGAAKSRRVPSLGRWTPILADAAKPALIGYYKDGLRRHVRSRKRIEPFSGGLDVFRREVLTAVDAASMKFAESTNATTKDLLETAIQKLKESLKAGLTEGEALEKLTKRVKEIFSTDRAKTIAMTEASRATHAGHVMAAKADGMDGKEWLSSSDACPLCQALEQQGVIPIDQPFAVTGFGAYAEIQHAPAHPHCFCSIRLTVL